MTPTLPASLWNSIIDAAQCLARGDYLQGVFLLSWSFDSVASPPKSMQKRLLFGDVELIDTGTIEQASNATVGISQRQTSPQPFPHSMEIGKSAVDSFHGIPVNAHYWVCHRCTLINERKRQKCVECGGVDRERPIKRRRSI